MGVDYSPTSNRYDLSFGPIARTRKATYVPVGATILPVDDTRDFNVGVKIVVCLSLLLSALDGLRCE